MTWSTRSVCGKKASPSPQRATDRTVHRKSRAHVLEHEVQPGRGANRATGGSHHPDVWGTGSNQRARLHTNQHHKKAADPTKQHSHHTHSAERRLRQPLSSCDYKQPSSSPPKRTGPLHLKIAAKRADPSPLSAGNRATDRRPLTLKPRRGAHRGCDPHTPTDG